MSDPTLILGSSSPYRKSLLEKLNFRFQCVSPDIDEQRLQGESASALASRLGQAKAEAVAAACDPEATWVVIGSDQVCHFDNEICGKPGSMEAALTQLMAQRGRWVTFTTSVALMDSANRSFLATEDYRCLYRDFSENEARQYLLVDEPWDCAGAIKVEAAGILLLENTEGRDINSLYGLPLMLLCEGLESIGYSRYDFML